MEEFVSWPYNVKIYDIFYKAAKSAEGFTIYLRVTHPPIQFFIGPSFTLTHKRADDRVTFAVHGPTDYNIKSSILKTIAEKEGLKYSHLP